MSSDNAQEVLQQVLVKTYFSNLEFLKECDETLYERVNALSHAMETGAYTPRYELEFIEDEGEFDIYDTKQELYLYNKKPKKYNNQAVSKVNFNEKGSFSTLEKQLLTHQDVDQLFVDKNEIQEPKVGLLKLYLDLHKYISVLNEDFSDERSFKHIDKFIFIGILLGRHIPGIVNKIKATNYFVHEPNLEIFRLSLFVLDYTLLISHGAIVTFSVMDDDVIFERKVHDYLKARNWENHTIKFHTTDYNVDNAFERISNGIIAARTLSFNHNMLLYNVIRNMTARVNKYKCIYFPLQDKVKLLQEKPVVYVAAGPSLDDSIDWLKENQNKFIIVSLGAVYKKLLAHDIEPDGIITLDGSYNVLNKLQFDEENSKKIQNAFILASSYTEQRILNRFNQDRLYLYQALASLKEDKIALQGYSVGEIGYQILLELGVKELYLIGTDLAIHQTKGHSHTTDSNSGLSTFNVESVVSSLEKGSFTLSDDLVKVKGNFLDEVYTTRILNNSLIEYNHVKIDEDQNVYNLCQHGAFIQGARPTKIEDIPVDSFEILSNKEDVLGQLVEELNSISTVGLDVGGKEKIKKDLEKLQEVINLIENYKTMPIANYEIFKSIFRKIIIEFIIYQEKGSFPLLSVLSFYYSVINMYIDYCFNNKKIKNEKRKIEKVSKLWFEDIETLLKDYMEYIKKAL